MIFSGSVMSLVLPQPAPPMMMRRLCLSRPLFAQFKNLWTTTDKRTKNFLLWCFFYYSKKNEIQFLSSINPPREVDGMGFRLGCYSFSPHRPKLAAVVGIFDVWRVSFYCFCFLCIRCVCDLAYQCRSKKRKVYLSQSKNKLKSLTTNRFHLVYWGKDHIFAGPRSCSTNDRVRIWKNEKQIV